MARKSPLGRLVALVAVMVVFLTSTAAAVVVDRFAALSPLDAPATQLTMAGTGAGQGVRGYLAPLDDTAFDPTQGYPTAKPAGFSDKSVGFAGTIKARDPNGTVVLTYCIDLRTPTSVGLGYTLGLWSDAAIPLVGYVARILDEYYPNTDQPTASSDRLRAAAVQSAIWFFTDKFVLQPSDAAYPLTSAIVADVLAKGPVTAPAPPSLQITPPADQEVALGRLAGPFTVSTTAPATLSVTGGTMWADAAGTVPVTNPVADGAQVWLRSTTPAAVTLAATAVATVPSGNVYLYSENDPNVQAAQKLILASESQVTTTAGQTALFFDTGRLLVEKVVTGDGAGLQSDVVLGVVCNDVALQDVTIPAGSPAGRYTATFTDIRTPATCVVTERSSGTNAQVTVETPDPVTVELPVTANPTDIVVGSLTNDYALAPGSLLVSKSVAGSGAALRGPVTIEVSCDDGTRATFDIPAGSEPDAAGYEVADLAAGTVCTVTETSDGGTTQAAVTVTTSPEGPVTIEPGAQSGVAITDTYTTNPGALLVTKTVAGDGAALRGPVTIDVTCDNGTTAAFEIPAGTPPDPAGYRVEGLPAGTVCSVAESVTGGTAEVSATVDVEPPGSVTIAPGATSDVAVTNTYTTNPGSLLVTKTVAGAGADLRGDVVIDVACDNGTAARFTIPAGTAPDPAGYAVEGLPAGTTCQATERQDGSSTAVGVVTVVGDQEPATIPPGGTGSIEITNTYTALPGSITVTKTIDGPGASERGNVRIDVVCGDGTTAQLLVPAGSPVGAPLVVDGIPAGSTCRVVETLKGDNQRVSVVVVGEVRDVEMPPGGDLAVTVTDTYDLNPGALVVVKSFAGAGQELRGDVVVDVRCGADGPDGSVLDTRLEFPPGSAAEPVLFELPAGTQCTVTESVDGSNDQVLNTVSVTVAGVPDAGGPVPVTPGDTVVVEVANDYVLRPGTATVTKTITGEGAGRQGEIVLTLTCASPPDVVPALSSEETAVIPAGATTVEPLVLTDVPAGSVCTAAETVDGATEEVAVTVQIPTEGQVMAPGGTVEIGVVDTYTPTDDGERPGEPGGPGEPELPATGSESSRTVTLAVLLLTMGALLVLAASRLGRER